MSVPNESDKMSPQDLRTDLSPVSTVRPEPEVAIAESQDGDLEWNPFGDPEPDPQVEYRIKAFGICSIEARLIAQHWVNEVIDHDIDRIVYGCWSHHASSCWSRAYGRLHDLDAAGFLTEKEITQMFDDAHVKRGLPPFEEWKPFDWDAYEDGVDQESSAGNSSVSSPGPRGPEGPDPLIATRQDRAGSGSDIRQVVTSPA